MTDSYLYILRRRLVPLLILSAFFAFVIFAALFISPKSYSASAEIEIGQSNVADSVLGQPAGYDDPARRVASEVEVLKSRPVLREAVAKLSSITPQLNDIDLSTRIDVVPVGTANQIRITASDADKSLAPMYAQAVVDAYIAFRTSQRSAELKQLQTELTKRLTEAEKDLQTVQKNLDVGETLTSREQIGIQLRVDTVSQQLEAVRLQQSVNSTGLSILSDASVPNTADGDLSFVARTGISLVGGILLSFVTIFFLELYRDRLRTPREASDVTGLATLAQLSLTAAANDSDSLDISSGDTRSLRLKLQHRSNGKMPRVLLFTSLALDTNITETVVLALARNCSHAGMRVLIITDEVTANTYDKVGHPVTRTSSDVAIRATNLAAVSWCRASNDVDSADFGLFDTAQPAEVLAELTYSFDTILFCIPSSRRIEPWSILHLVHETLVVARLNLTQGRKIRSFAESLQIHASHAPELILVTGDGRSVTHRDTNRDANPLEHKAYHENATMRIPYSRPNRPSVESDPGFTALHRRQAPSSEA